MSPLRQAQVEPGILGIHWGGFGFRVCVLSFLACVVDVMLTPDE